MIPQRRVNWAESLTGRGISMTNVHINHKSLRERERQLPYNTQQNKLDVFRFDWQPNYMNNKINILISSSR